MSFFLIRFTQLSSLVSRLSSLVLLTFLAACSDFFEPVDSTPAPTEYTYNYWLLKRTYLFEDELPLLDEQGDSVSELYSKLSDPYTRYVPPAKSEATKTKINTSIVPGDVGMEYSAFPQSEHPLLIYRVYPESPAGRAGIPRYGIILNVNGVEIVSDRAKAIYDSVLTYNRNLSIKVAYQGDTTTYNVTKEDVYAPTVFIDTLNGIEIITIAAFKLNTVDKENGTLGELTTYLNATRNTTAPRLIDLRNNPGGHVKHCTAMADLFIEKGILSNRSWRGFAGDGTPTYNTESEKAVPGDAGEGKHFIALVNRNSASCAEIFAAALQEGAEIPIAGDTTYGKGIGQSTWNTMNGGLAIITNLEFLTPKGKSYHKKGIVPDYYCKSPSIICGLEAIQKYYGKKVTKTAIPDYLNHPLQRTRNIFEGGAFVDGEQENL
ncbi:MAG: peptidase S41 [Fibrobacter sp.]|nr:peptidase S41 [Fibrobacter sp.]